MSEGDLTDKPTSENPLSMDTEVENNSIDAEMENHSIDEVNTDQQDNIVASQFEENESQKDDEVMDTEQSEQPKDTQKKERIVRQRDINRFPITRIRTIMKMDPDLTIASQESVFLISRAAELFVQYQAQEAYKRTKVSKRKTVQKRDLDNAINELDCMAFLEGAID